MYSKVIQLYIHTHTHTHILFQILFHYRLLQDIKYSFLFLLFFVKAKVLSGFPSVGKNRCQWRSFIKAKWYKANVRKVGICLHQKTCICVDQNTCPKMIIVELFVVVRNEKLLKCPSNVEWINKLWCIHNEILYSSENELPHLHSTMWIKFTNIMLSKRSQT